MAINEETHKEIELDFLDQVGFKLGYIRSEIKHLSQKEALSKIANKYHYKISRQHLSELERGKANITLFEAVLFCGIYGVAIEDLLVDCVNIYKPNKVPPYQSHIKPGMTSKEIKRTANEMDEQLKTIYEQVRKYQNETM